MRLKKEEEELEVLPCTQLVAVREVAVVHEEDEELTKERLRLLVRRCLR
jgi:hypothetical protein